MQRIAVTPRDNWQERVESVGMLYHTIDGAPYWDESACYRFTRAEIDTIDVATAELHSLCLQAVEEVIRRDLFAKLRIPKEFAAKVIDSWENDEPTLYGRFDLVWDGNGAPKMYEYNADTPTSLLEASVVQWFWLRETRPDHDQFNSIHEKLIRFWQRWPGLERTPVHFACAGDAIEDLGNLEYLRDTALQGGARTRRLFIEEIGWDSARMDFVDLDEAPIRVLFKLYPWEWMIREEFGRHLTRARIRLLEPAWKMVLSNKGILPILWDLFEGHPNLLQASFEERPMQGEFVRKPLFSREGSNIEIHREGGVLSTPGSYGGDGCILQRYQPLPCFGGNYPVIGSWVIDGDPAGIGIREDATEITTNGSRFLPHYFVEG
ncbi:glutathionylspermidine synthase family protein [Geomonas sp. Red69]|uniref:Glutathionylspermidine synthase family protein n=1 Tax=Geomonas diazotrophica TaxID=2843197 RepID=A0ABX8JJL8_9BACT|nr:MULTISPECIES: glutathionylspermidine synthase family protein [Geomonas]MBU5635139.1 glutathionylspermidine synthase family protein [Geomonas diazotrophica]QWV97814.1 glutathionylspermidine synthase family protein [Geomonas nitrogeniifigens]QXE86954.1 glutathionylspermidine synthase family protein [Geomonas nitrogeniifigens]